MATIPEKTDKSNKTFQGRIIQKHDTEANWKKATNFVPLKGEIIIYDDLNKIKIGDGSTKVNDLKFVDANKADIDLLNVEIPQKITFKKLYNKNFYYTSTGNKWENIYYLNNKFILHAENADFLCSTNGNYWSQPITITSIGGLSPMVYGNGKYIVLGSLLSDSGLYSSDGDRWYKMTLPVEGVWYSLCYANNKFIALDSNNHCGIYSTDGIIWTKFDLSVTVSGSFSNICYGNNKFVVGCDNSNKILYSTDGITWSETTLSSSYSYYHLCFVDDKFILTTASSVILISNDGITWTTATLPVEDKWSNIYYCNNIIFILNSDGTKMLISLDKGSTWENVINAPSEFKINSLAYGNNKYILAGSGGNKYLYTITFPNNIFEYLENKYNQAPPSGMLKGESNLLKPAIANTDYIAPDNIKHLIQYEDAEYLLPTTHTKYCNYDKIVYGNNTFVALASAYDSSEAHSYFIYSIDGINWTEKYVSNREWQDICFGDNKFVAISKDGYIAYSTDGISWDNKSISSLGSNWTEIAYGNSLFVILDGETGVVIYSKDLTAWTKLDSKLNSEYGWSNLLYTGNQWLIMQNQDTNLYTSPNLIQSFTALTENSIFSGYPRRVQIVCRDKKFLAIDDTGYIAYSENGKAWETKYLEDGIPSKILYNDKIFVVFYSQSEKYLCLVIEDYAKGIMGNISLSDTTKDNKHYDAGCYGNNLFVAFNGGAGWTTGQNIIFSNDGIHWTNTYPKLTWREGTDIVDKIKNVLNTDHIVNKYTFTATAGQSTFTIPFDFKDSSALTVYYNGVMMKETDNYTVFGKVITLVDFTAEAGDYLTVMGIEGAAAVDFGEEAANAIIEINKTKKETINEIKNVTSNIVFLNKANVMTSSGKITMDSSFTPSTYDLVTKKYVDDSKPSIVGTSTAYPIYIGSSTPASGTAPLLWIDTTSSTGVFKYRTSTTGTWTAVPVAYT